ncbi:MAG: hypothetical protein ACLR3C_09245 [Eggerthella lenta]
MNDDITILADDSASTSRSSALVSLYLPTHGSAPGDRATASSSM